MKLVARPDHKVSSLTKSLPHQALEKVQSAYPSRYSWRWLWQDLWQSPKLSIKIGTADARKKAQSSQSAWATGTLPNTWLDCFLESLCTT
jgi:hypothetical protein